LANVPEFCGIRNNAAILDLKLCAEMRHSAQRTTAHHSALATRGIARFSGNHLKKNALSWAVCAVGGAVGAELKKRR
jgi:hypothetical protein